MEKVLFNETSYCKDEKFLKFMEKYHLICEYLYKDKLKCYSANQKEADILIFILKTSSPLLLGEGNYFYGKYRILRYEFRKLFSLIKECEFKNICPGILIYPDESSSNERIMIKNSNDKTPLGIKVEKIKNNSEGWLLKVRNRYGTQHLLKTKEGYIIGPEESLLLITETYLRLFTPKKVLEMGAGTGEVSAFILKNAKNSKAYVNEKSPYLKEHLKNYLSKIFKKRVKIIFGDIQKIKIPKVDLIISGIFYGELPKLMKNKGEQIKNALGKKGLFIIQSGMLENMFALTIIDPSIFPKILGWKWYNHKYDLRNYFNYVFSFFLEGELITLASQDKKIIKKIRKDLNKKIVPLKSL